MAYEACRDVMEALRSKYSGPLQARERQRPTAARCSLLASSPPLCQVSPAVAAPVPAAPRAPPELPLSRTLNPHLTPWYRRCWTTS